MLLVCTLTRHGQNTGIERVCCVKERGKDRRKEGRSMSGQTKNTLWRFREFKWFSHKKKKKKLLSTNTSSHTHTASRPSCYTWSPLSLLAPHTLSPHSTHRHHLNCTTLSQPETHRQQDTPHSAPRLTLLWPSQQIKLIIPNLCQIV